MKSARARALSRGDRFISAAADLLRETGKPDFTVQEVVDRSGMSLRSFYHHFATKEDLLLALVEESISAYVRRIQPKVDAAEDPVDKLHTFVTGLYGMDDKASRGMLIFVWQLISTRTEEFVSCLAPQTKLLREIIDAGVLEGKFRDDVSVPVLTAYFTHSMTALMNMRIMHISLTDEELTVDDFWKCCLGAVSPPALRRDAGQGGQLGKRPPPGGNTSGTRS